MGNDVLIDSVTEGDGHSLQVKTGSVLHSPLIFFISVSPTPLNPGPRTTVIVHIQLVSGPTSISNCTKTICTPGLSLVAYYLHPSTNFINIFIGKNS